MGLSGAVPYLSLIVSNILPAVPYRLSLINHTECIQLNKSILFQEWLAEFKRTMAQISHNLGQLSKEKMKEAEDEIRGKLLPTDLTINQGVVESNVNKNKKTVVNLKFDDDNAKENSLMRLLLDLESVCSHFHGGYEQEQVCLIYILYATLMSRVHKQEDNAPLSCPLSL